MKAQCPILGRQVECDSTEWSRDSWDIVRCQETGFVFLANPPEYTELETDFAWEKTSTAERVRRRLDEPVVNRLSNLSKRIRAKMRPNRNRVGALVERYVREFPIDDEIGVLDIGCGSGHQLLDLQRRLAMTQRKMRPCGIEISRNLAEAAHASVSAFGGHVAQASALDGLRSFGEMEFDVVMMISYLEHEFQPLAVLEEVQRILKPQGVCVLKVPNFASLNRRVRGKRWCGFRYPDHVNYFTPHTLRLVAAAAGLKVKRQAISDRFPLSDNMYAVLTRD